MVDEIFSDSEGEPVEDSSFLPIPLRAAVNAASNIVGEISMIPVASSDIAAWGYDPVGFNLKIEFTNGRIYQYSNITPMEFEALVMAPSAGSAFWALIRRNPVAHPFMRLA